MAIINVGRHKNILTEILKAIYTDVTLAPYLAFKGGTAALFNYNLPRFSVDLDFDLRDPSKEEYVFERVHTLLETFGTVKDSVNKRYGLFFKLSYTEKVDGDENVKIEISKRNFGSTYTLLQYHGIPIMVMIKEDMVAHKLVAMYERMGKANRDIFDVWYFLKNRWPVNKQIIEQRTNLSYREFLEKSITSLRLVNRRHILDGLGELLTEKQKAWVKKNLVNEVLFYLRLSIENDIEST